MVLVIGLLLEGYFVPIIGTLAVNRRVGNLLPTGIPVRLVRLLTLFIFLLYDAPHETIPH